jgi:hypothetical protein
MDNREFRKYIAPTQYIHLWAEAQAHIDAPTMFPGDVMTGNYKMMDSIGIYTKGFLRCSQNQQLNFSGSDRRVK